MQQSPYGEEMLDLMEMAEKITEADVNKKKGIDVDDVRQAALSTAKKIFDDIDKKKIEKMVKDACSDSDDTAEAIEKVQGMMRSDEAREMGYSGQAMDTSGPGAKKRTTRNDYTKQEVADMLQYAQKFINNGKQVESWKYSQDWLNAVGNTMRQFINLNSGDPALDYEPGEMQGQASDWGYKPNKHGKANADANMKGNSPGPQRGSKMSSEHDINKRRSTKRSTRTDYNK